MLAAGGARGHARNHSRSCAKYGVFPGHSLLRLHSVPAASRAAGDQGLRSPTMWTMAGSHCRQTLGRNIWTRWMALYLRARGGRRRTAGSEEAQSQLGGAYATLGGNRLHLKGRTVMLSNAPCPYARLLKMPWSLPSRESARPHATMSTIRSNADLQCACACDMWLEAACACACDMWLEAAL